MLINRFLLRAPLCRISRIFADIAQIAHRMMKIHFHKKLSGRFSFYLSTKDDHIFLLCKSLLVVHKYKMTNLIQFHHNRIHVIICQRTTFHNRGIVGNKCHITRTKAPLKLIRKPTGILISIKEIHFLFAHLVL